MFIKSLSVLDCKDLVQHTLPTIASCRSRLNVTSERAYTRHQFIRAELDKASSATSVAAGTPKATCSVKRGRPLTPAPGSTVVKRRKVLTTQVIELHDTDSDTDADDYVQYIKTEPGVSAADGLSSCVKSWPSDFYVKEVVDGFQKITELSHHRGYNIQKAFTEVFSLSL